MFTQSLNGPQLSFPDAEFWPRSVPGLIRPRARRRRGRDNFFWAVQPNEEVVHRLTDLARRARNRHQLRGRVFDPWRFHVSMLGLSEYFDDATEVLRFADEAAARIKTPPFAARFTRALTFSSHADRKPFVIAADSNHRFGSLLQAQVKTMFGDARKVHFTPHATLLYDEKVVAEHAIEPIEWTVREFVLIQSHVGQGRPYSVLGRWRLNE